MLAAQAAIGWTTATRSVGLFYTGVFLERPPGCLGVEQYVAINLISEITMFQASFLDKDSTVLNEIPTENNSRTHWTERFDRSR